MAATTNRRFTELYRNSTVFETKQAAITGLYNHELINSLKDGEPLLARYMAYFTWDEGSKQYVLQSTKNDSATFTRIVSNETSVTSTKEYIVGDIINVTATEGNITTTKSYKCSSIPQGGVAVPVGSNFATSGYFTEITSASVTPQSVKTIRVLMAVATVFEDNSGNPSFKKEPPKGRLTIFEEDDAIREMINKASISSPDGTININDVVSGKEIQVNLGTSLVKNITPGANFGKIDVNFDGKTIIQDSTSNALKVNHGNTLKESETSGEVGKLDVKTGDTIKISAGGTGNPDAGTLDVKTGTSLKVSAGGASNPELGTIDVNIDNHSIKQYASDYATAALQNKLYVNVDNASGLNLDSTNGIQVKLGNALAFRSGDSTAANNGKIDVRYDDNTIGLNGSNQLVTNFHSETAGGSTTMERKSHTSGDETVYDGWGVKHGTTISENTNGIHVNFDDVSIKQIASGLNANKLYVNHDTTIVTDSTNGLGVNIDNQSIKQYPSDYGDASGSTPADATKQALQNKLYVNIDNLTIKQDDTTKPDQLYVNIDKSTLVSDPTTGVISVNPTSIPVFGENATEVVLHLDNTDPENPVEDGKTVKLKINREDKVLTQNKDGLLTNITISDVTNSEALPSNVLKRYRLLGKNTASADQDPSYAQIGDAIDIYRDSSLIDAHLGHIGDVLKPESEWAEGHATPVYPTDYTVATSSNDALCFVYLLADETYQLVTVDVESFLSENEFKDGLQVVRDTYSYSQIHYVPEGITWDSTNSGSSLPSTVDENSPEYYKVDDGTDVTYYKKSSNGVVSVKVWNGIELYENASGQNKSLCAKIGDGIAFDLEQIDGKRPIIARIGNGLQFNSNATSGKKPIELRLGDGLEYNTSETDGQRSVKVKVGTGIGFDGTSHAIYVNYGTIGAANRPVYWDGANHTPVQIDYEINKTVPADAVFTDTTYSSGNEITIDPTNNHINHNAKLGTAFVPTTVGTTISGFGGSGSFKVPILSINEYGHVTGASEATMTIAIPEAKIVTYTAPQYTQGHLSQNWVTTYIDNAITVGEIYDSAINKLDNKIKVLADELSDAEAVLTQAIEDEPRYYAKSSSAGDASAITATLVDSRKFAVDGNNSNKPLNGTKVDVYFSTAHTTSTATLNINNTGAFPLVYNDANFDATLIQAGTTLALVFDKEYNSNAGCYRVVGGVGSGSGSTNGITEIDEGNGISITKNYDEVQINPNATPYSSTWFTLNAGADPVVPITPENNKVYRVTTSGNYYNMAYTWDAVNSKYVLSTDISVTAAVKLAANMIPEGSTSGGASEISGLATLLKFTTTGELAMENTWDCGTY